MSATPDSMFTSPEQRIADLERQLVVREAELAERTAQRDEALRRETATAEVLQIINSSPGDLAPVFDAILEKATGICAAAFGILFTYDGECFDAVALKNVPVAFAADLEQPARPSPGAALDRLSRGERFVHFPDVAVEDAYASGKGARQQVELGGARSLLGVPLRRKGAFLGAFIVYRQEVRPFADKQIALLQNFAAQAAIAMENARLITETREALEQQTATAEVLQVINSSPSDLRPVFDAMLEKALRLCEAAYGVLWIFDGGWMSAGALYQVPAAFAEFVSDPQQPSPESGQGRIMRGEGTIVVPNMDVLPADVASDPLVRASRELGGARSLVVAPLRRESITLGSISIYRREVRPFTDQQIALLENFADQAVIAMENARLITETREALERQTALAEILGVINSSLGNLTPVFDAILEKAHSLCDVSFICLLTYDGERFHTAAQYGLPIQFREVVGNAFQAGPNNPLSRLVHGERFVHMGDAVENSGWGNCVGYSHLFDAGSIRTMVLVSLRKHGALLGAIAAFRQEVRPFTDKQIALLQNFAAQVVIAIENARLLTETREALEQQTATAEVLGVINSSPGDLAPVFDAILEKAHSLCAAERGALVGYDGEMLRAVATRGMPAPFDEVLRRGFPLASGMQLMDRLQRGEPVHIHDMKAAATESPVELARLQRKASELAGTRTLLMVPLCKERTFLGYLAAYRTEVRPFSDKEIALVENFAAQAVIAMENARLLTETREALEQQTATAEVLQVINSSPGDLTPVFDTMLEKARALGGAAFGTFMLREGERFYAGAVHGAVPEPFARILREGFVPSASSPIGRLLAGEAWVHIPDLAAILSAMADDDPVPRTAVEAGVRTLLMVPLVKDGELIGLFTNFRQEVRPFTDKQIALLQNFAAQAVIAMENARLLTETREALQQQTATAEVLQVINSSPGDVVPVFDEMLRKAMHLCDAAFGSFAGFDNESFHNLTNRGVPKALADALRAPQSPTPGGAFARLVAGEAIVHIADVKDDDAYRAGLRGRVAMVDIGGARTAIWVALRKEGQLLGAYVIYRQEVRPFSDKQIALLQNFAQQAVIAMENARLLRELRQRTEEVAELNRGLEARVAEQVDELGRVGRLKRFLAPQLAELIVSQGDEKILESHRREIVVVFCDLRGYTAFTETAEPEEVLDFLREYHGALGPLVSQFEGTLDQFSGDGIMVFFNDPVPCPDPAERAVKMAMAMREAAGDLIAAWRRHGSELGFGAGIAQGYATLGQIGFSDRSGYTAIGTVCNLAARLCAEAKDGQILVSSRIAEAVGAIARLEDLGNLELRGLRRPVAAFNIVESSAADARPNLTVVVTEPGA